MESQAFRSFPVGDIGAKRSYRRAPACADAIADRRIESVPIVERIARIDEYRSAPVARDPAGVFDTAEREVTAADHRIALRDADRFEGIPADRLVAAGFGEFQPLDAADTPEARDRTRRIELKLTER